MSGAAAPPSRMVVTEVLADTSTTPPVLAIPGFAAGAWYFTEHLAPSLAERGTSVFAVDLRGHGNARDGVDIGSVRLRDYVTDALAAAEHVRDRTGQEPILLGHSMGSLLARMVHAQRSAPALVLTSFGDVRRSLRSFMGWLARTAPLGAAGMVLTGTGRRLWSRPEIHRRILFGDRTGPDVRRWSEMFAAQPDSDRVFRDIMRLRVDDGRRVPTMVIHGSHDPIAPAAAVQPLATRLGATYVVRRDAAHDLFLASPWQHTAEDIAGFVRQVAQQPAS